MIESIALISDGELERTYVAGRGQIVQHADFFAHVSGLRFVFELGMAKTIEVGDPRRVVAFNGSIAACADGTIWEWLGTTNGWKEFPRIPRD